MRYLPKTAAPQESSAFHPDKRGEGYQKLFGTLRKPTEFSTVEELREYALFSEDSHLEFNPKRDRRGTIGKSGPLELFFHKYHVDDLHSPQVGVNFLRFVSGYGIPAHVVVDMLFEMLDNFDQLSWFLPNGSLDPKSRSVPGGPTLEDVFSLRETVTTSFVVQNPEPKSPQEDLRKWRTYCSSNGITDQLFPLYSYLLTVPVLENFSPSFTKDTDVIPRYSIQPRHVGIQAMSGSFSTSISLSVRAVNNGEFRSVGPVLLGEYSSALRRADRERSINDQANGGHVFRSPREVALWLFDGAPEYYSNDREGFSRAEDDANALLHGQIPKYILASPFDALGDETQGESSYFDLGSAPPPSVVPTTTVERRTETAPLVTDSYFRLDD